MTHALCQRLTVSAPGLGCMGMSQSFGPRPPRDEMISLLRARSPWTVRAAHCTCGGTSSPDDAVERAARQALERALRPRGRRPRPRYLATSTRTSL